MAKLVLVLDTNIIIDYLAQREPHCRDARLLMVCGRMGEFELWMSSSQITDLIYILSEGVSPARMPAVLESLRGLRTFVGVHAIGADEVDAMLVTDWDDPEDALLHEVALRVRADAIVTRNRADFERAIVPAFDCAELFAWAKERFGLDYDEVPL